MRNSILGDQKTLSVRASALRLTARNLAESMKNGGFRSSYRGQGIEFDGVREYLRGDDVRSIDWNVTARMGKPFVKMFEEEHELQIFLIIDDSFSMDIGSKGRSRIQSAHEAGALITLASFFNDSPIGAVFFDGQIGFSCRPQRGQERMLLLLSKFDTVNEHRIKGSVLQNAVKGACRILRNRSLVVVISDFRNAGWEKPFTQLCLRNDVVAVRVTDPVDSELPESGSIPFVDPETSVRQVIPTNSSDFRDAWRTDHEKRIELWKKNCLRRGAVPLILSTDADPAAVLTNFFGSRERI
jgi:uncharacterized protein (DUF58 family)